MSWKTTKRRWKRKLRRAGRRSAVLPVLGVVLLIGALVWLYSKYQESNPAVGDEQQSVCLLLVDRSASIGDDFRSVAKTAVSGCESRKGRLLIRYFDQGSGLLQDTASEGSGSQFELWTPRKRTDAARDKALQDARREALAAIDDVFDAESSAQPGSHIIGAMSQAASLLRAQADRDGVTTLYLLVVTDGWQRNPSLDVQGLNNGVTPEELVDLAAQQDAVPRLDGIEVGFAGPTEGVDTEGNSVAMSFDASVKRFWRLIVEKGAGRFCAYGGPALNPGQCEEASA